MADCTQDGECVCQKGFIGDGTWCAINTTDCNIVPMLCNANASCIETRCQCLPGFVGDGFSCYRARETDCRFSAAVCHKNALCLDGACQCAPGFVGDGLKCEAASNIASLVPIVVPIGPGWGPTTVAPEKFNQLLISSLTPAGTLSVTNSINESSTDLKKVTDGEPPARSLDTKSVSLTSQTAEKQESTTTHHLKFWAISDNRAQKNRLDSRSATYCTSAT
uniref:EGF-like domain-containing protein n=1 Tax=Romanomermis culicivorax TaxID=13658 RepID=A0A915I731_ROMCU